MIFLSSSYNNVSDCSQSSKLVPMAEQTVLSLTWSETPKDRSQLSRCGPSYTDMIYIPLLFIMDKEKTKYKCTSDNNSDSRNDIFISSMYTTCCRREK